MNLNLQALVVLRKQKKISQAEMAQALGYAQSVYHRIEKGVIDLKARHIPIIAMKLGMKPSQLAKVLFCEKKTA